MRRTAPLLFPVAATLLIGLVGLILSPRLLAQSWLVATVILLAIPVGAQAVLMTHGLTGGQWGAHSQPFWRALAATLPVGLLALLPLLFALDLLFPWTQPPAELPKAVQHKTFYLNKPFFVGRTLFYGLIWLGLALLLGVWRGRARAIYAPGLLLWVLTVTFFGYDWLMSLEPEFYTDVFGLMLVCQWTTATFAVALLWMGRRTPAPIRRDLAHLWVSLMLGWVFLMFSQYIVIWSANIPAEIGWYVHRSTPGWRWVSWLAFGLFFLAPFLILLGGVGHHPGRLVVAATLCLIGHLLHSLWLLVPSFGALDGHLFWLTPALLLGFGLTAWNLARTNRLQQKESDHG